MNSQQKQQPDEQADGYARDPEVVAREYAKGVRMVLDAEAQLARRPVPKDDARSMINNARQILEGHRQRAVMAMGRDAFEAAMGLLAGAVADIDRERAERRQVVKLAIRRTVAPDPAHVDMLAEMEKTNRELGLSGDALEAHLAAEGLDR